MTDTQTRSSSDSRAVALIGLPYLFGIREPSYRNHMALGPTALLTSDILKEGISRLGRKVKYVMIDDADEPAADEMAGYSSFNVVGLFAGDQLSRMLIQNARLAKEVRDARKAGYFPLAATGACSAAVGMVAGLGDDQDIGMIWLDAHDDASTPETSESGLMEGMPAAMIAGRCWTAYCKKIPGFRPIPAERILTIGLHETHNYEEKLRNPVLKNFVNPPMIKELGYESAVESALDQLATMCGKVYVHLDVDVLDPSVVQISHHMAHGGITIEQLHFTLTETARRFDVVGMDYSCFDPSLDRNATDVLAKSMVFSAETVATTK
jgi:arginase